MAQQAVAWGRAATLLLMAATGQAAEPAAEPMAAASVAASVAGIAAGAAPAAPDAAQLADTEWIRAGRLRFVQVCAYCHGTRGDAGKTASFQTRRGWDPQAIHDVIANGRVNGANVMPSWKQSIPDEMIWKLVAFIKSLSADAVAPGAAAASGTAPARP